MEINVVSYFSFFMARKSKQIEVLSMEERNFVLQRKLFSEYKNTKRAGNRLTAKSPPLRMVMIPL